MKWLDNEGVARLQRIASELEIELAAAKRFPLSCEQCSWETYAIIDGCFLKIEMPSPEQKGGKWVCPQCGWDEINWGFISPRAAWFCFNGTHEGYKGVA